MKKTRTAKLLAAALPVTLALSATACQKRVPPPPPEPEVVTPPAPPPSDVDPIRLTVFQPPLPAEFTSLDNPLTEEKITLGRMLYYEPRLSKNHDVSCNTCHDLEKFGVDGKKVSNGHKAQPGTRNSPTVYNAAGHATQFWDGRAKDVEAQAEGPMMNPVEMANGSQQLIETTLRSIPEYVALFKKAFPADKQPVTFRNAALAIGAFERRLVTPSRFDKFVAGDKNALTEKERIGLNKFFQVGCTTCHSGPLLGGQLFQKLGLVRPWPNQTDRGRITVTKRELDDMMFKVPSLRNIEKTAPYFHDGSAATLEESVKMMASHQLGNDLPTEDVDSITAFMKSLTGTIPEDYIKKPALPKNGPKTPKPDPS